MAKIQSKTRVSVVLEITTNDDVSNEGSFSNVRKAAVDNAKNMLEAVLAQSAVKLVGELSVLSVAVEL